MKRRGRQLSPEVPIASGPQVRHVGDVAGNMAWTLLGNLFPPLAMLVSAPILAQSLGVDARGEVAAATAPLTLVITAATFGIPDAVTYVIARQPNALRRTQRSALALIVLAGLIATGVVVLASTWLSDGNTTIQKLMVVASLAIVPSLIVAVLRGSAAGLHQWRRVTVERLLSALTRVAALIPLAITDHLNATTATIVIAVGPLVGAAAYFGLRAPKLGQQATSDEPGLRFLVGFGLRVWIGAISGILLSRLDQVLMTPLSSSYELGIYAVAATIADIPLIINRAVRDVTFSADAAQATEARLGASARISSTASAVLGLITGVTMLWWLPLLFGQEFAPAIPATAVLLLAAVLGAPGSIAGAGLSARGRPGLRSASLVISCVVNVAILFALVPSMGAMGAAIATLVGSLIAANSNIIFLWRIFDMSPREFYGIRRDDFQIAVRFASRMWRRARSR